MKFESRDLEYQVPTIKEYLANCPNEHLRARSNLIKIIWLPSPKGFLTLEGEIYKLFIHRNSNFGTWVLENLDRIVQNSRALCIKCLSDEGRDFELFELENTVAKWTPIADPAKGLRCKITSPPSQIPSKSKTSATTSRKAPDPLS